jgi:TonB dependent receptor/Carboxypeptidase regulatory-like domain
VTRVSPLAVSIAAIGFAIATASAAAAQVFGTVRVSTRDQQNLPLANATVTLTSVTSRRTQTATTNADGDVVFLTVPIGQYVVGATFEGLAPAHKDVGVGSNAVTPVQLQLTVAGLQASVDIVGAVQTINPESSRTTTLVARDEILREPDADRSGSLAMITNNTPGAYVMHDHLHSRGGHGVSWQIDGVPVPNSNLATVGAQFDPKDVDSLEVNRGGLGTNYGDRSYGVFNIVPRSGFEGRRFADLTAAYGSYTLANVHFALGDHTDDQKFAYFASASGNHTERGLERVDIPVLHDAANSVSGFTSIISNKSIHDQFRFVGAARTDRYEVPNTVAQAAAGISDREVATDTFANFTWLHTTDTGGTLTVSPYFHFNRLEYNGGPGDPIITTDNRESTYLGAYAAWAETIGRHTVRVGTDSFAEWDDTLFGLESTTGAKLTLRERERLRAGVLSVFAEDTFRVTPWLTLNNGLRYEHFNGTLDEHGVSPRLGGAMTIPHLGVLRASYSRYYQHPQTSTISGPVLQFAVAQGFDFLPVPGERDEVWEVGLGIPAHGWTVDFDAYHNATKNAVDHEVLGNSNILFPLTIARGRVRAAESSVKSPLLFGRLQFHCAFAYQIAQGKGQVTGGLTDFQPPAGGYFYLDHDQRVTLTNGATITLPHRAWTSVNVVYGSGFLLGDGPDHMPQHATVDLAVGTRLGDKLSLRVSALNVANNEFLTGFENSFAGTHYSNPRELSVQVRYTFHY